MGRKVFISFLGEGFYQVTKYNQGKSDLTETRFIQRATLELIGARNWETPSAAFIMLTDKARKVNWDHLTERSYQGKMTPYNGLEEELKDMELPFETCPIRIPDGNDEKEMFDIFMKLFDQLNDQDELYLDMTHGFRYLPMFLLVLGNYATLLKGITLKHMSYGNVFVPDKDIMDLLPLSRLQDWTIGAADFVKNGSVTDLVKLSDNEMIPILREARGSDANANYINNFVKKLKEVISELKMCRCKELIRAKNIKLLREYAAMIDMSEKLVAFAPIQSKIIDSLREFSSEPTFYNGLVAAKWCNEHSLYQQAITYLRETVLSYICEQNQWNLFNEEIREMISSCFNCVWENTTYKGLESMSPDKVMLVEQITHLPYVIANCDWYCRMASVRNDMNHAGMKDNSQKKENLEKQIKGYIASFEASIKTPDAVDNEEGHLLLNLSNHPYAVWSERQQQAASAYGEVVDIPFPEIPEDIDEDGIEQMANKYIDSIILQSSNRPCNIHIMGEMTFTYAMVNRLKSLGYTCIASTSKRIVEDRPDGTKNVRFEFCRFREY